MLVPGGVLAFTDIVSIAPLTDAENAKLAAEMQFPPIVTAQRYLDELSRAGFTIDRHDDLVGRMEGDSRRADRDVSLTARDYDREVWRSALREVGLEICWLLSVSTRRTSWAAVDSSRRGLASASRARSLCASSRLLTEQGSFGAGLASASRAR